MKRFVLLAALAFGVMSVQAQEQVVALGKATDNVQVGIDGGATTLLKGHSFFGNVRGGFGLHVDKMFTPVFGMGIEANAFINTSHMNYGNGMISASNKLTIDETYAGIYGKVNLFNLFCGYNCDGRKFDIDAIAGCGWDHYYFKKATGENYWNAFATKAGLSFNYNPTKHLTISLKPSVSWNMTDVDIDHTSCGYDIRAARFNLFASVSYNFGGGFDCVRPYDQAEVDGLNAIINDLRAQLDACAVANAECAARVKKLEDDLAACEARKAVVKEVVSNYLSSVRYVFYKIGSSKITADQMPNVEMVASYLKNHPGSKVEIKGYASQDGPLDVNIRLAAARAESVKNALINKYKISADRISAEGQGIGHMFEEESWNRVAICTLDGK